MNGVKNFILTAGALILGWTAVIVMSIIGSIAFCVAYIYLLLIGKQDYLCAEECIYDEEENYYG
jgi:hypothetical protein